MKKDFSILVSPRCYLYRVRIRNGGAKTYGTAPREFNWFSSCDGVLRSGELLGMSALTRDMDGVSICRLLAELLLSLAVAGVFGTRPSRHETRKSAAGRNEAIAHTLGDALLTCRKQRRTRPKTAVWRPPASLA